jgi:hypothetical protein
MDQLEDEDTGSVTAFAMASLWLHDCLTRHSKCRKYSIGFSPMPSRVINVGPPDGSQAPYIYSSRGHHDAYVTLSYRWGNTNPIRTEMRKLQTFGDWIPLNRVSKTMNDAITITRRLGVRYLWIDALCIVQDSKMDWIREASNTVNIYRNSLLTIAVVHSGPDAEGIFSRRHRTWTRQCELPKRQSYK